MRRKLGLLLMVGVVALAACKMGDNTAPKVRYEIFLAAGQDADETNQRIDLANKIFHVAHRNDDIAFYDAVKGKVIVTKQIPDADISETASEEIFDEEVKPALAESLGKAEDIVKGGSVDIVAIAHRLGDRREEHPHATFKVVIVGSPYLTTSNGETFKKALPDSALCAENSPFRIQHGKKLDGVEVHYLYTTPGNASLDSCTSSNLRRFVNLFIGKQNGMLLTFSNDTSDFTRLLAKNLVPNTDELHCENSTAPICAPLMIAIGNTKLKKPAPPAPLSAPASPAPKRRHSPTPKQHIVPKQPDKKVDCPCFGKR